MTSNTHYKSFSGVFNIKHCCVVKYTYITHFNNDIGILQSNSTVFFFVSLTFIYSETPFYFEYFFASFLTGNCREFENFRMNDFYFWNEKIFTSVSLTLK